LFTEFFIESTFVYPESKSALWIDQNSSISSYPLHIYSKCTPEQIVQHTSFYSNCLRYIDSTLLFDIYGFSLNKKLEI